jgi:tetratricopeptide (TPR) repeat protein
LNCASPAGDFLQWVRRSTLIFADMPRNLITLTFLFLSLALSAQADKLTDARKALAGEDARAQIAAFDSLVVTGAASPELYQALGNAHFSNGDYGKAILNYERGLRLKPGSKELKNNLKYVRAEAGINRLELPDFFLARWWRGVGAAFGAGTLFWLAIVFWWLAVAGAVMWFLRRKKMDEKRRFALLPGAVVCLVTAAIFLSMGNSRNAWLDNDKEAVLTAKIADLRVAPGPEATLEKSLTQGLKLRLLDEFDGYVKVALDDGKQGWLPVDAVEKI